MKNFNFIKRLWVDSHEKHLPQRLGHYAAMLFLFLTLGMGQMWALDIYLDISAANWPADGATIKLYPGTGSDVTGTSVATNLYKFTVTSATGTMWFKRMNLSTTWDQGSVTYNSSYNLYKLTGWDAAACSNANVSTSTKTNYIYFDNSVTGWSNSYKYFVIGHDYPSEYSKIYSMTAISNTKLWYIAQSSDSWVDATYYAVCSPTSSWSGTSWGSSNIKNANKYAAPYTGKYDMNNGSSYLIIPASSSNNCTLSIDYKSGYTALNHAQTVYKYTSSGGTTPASYTAQNVNSGTVTISAYKMTGNGTASNTSNSATINTASTTSASKDAAYTGEVTLTASANTGYSFVGWFESTSATTAISTETEYTYNAPNSTKAIYARFKANSYTVTLTTNSGTINSGNVTSYTYGVGATLPTNVTRTGYKFGGWYESSTFSGSPVTSISTTATGDKTYYAEWLQSTISATVTPSSIAANTPTNFTFNLTFNNWVSGQYYTIGNQAGGYFVSPTAITTNTASYTTTDNGSYPVGTLYFPMKLYSSAAASDATLLYTCTLSVVVSSATYNVSVGVSPSGYGTVSESSINASPDDWSSNITATPNPGYKFDSWSNGANVTLNASSTTNPIKIKASAVSTLTANFSAATYRVMLNNQSATSVGTEYVDATYKSTTLSTITKPTKTNYTFGGYYTETDGGGTQIIDANGNWLASKTGYTDGSNKSLVTEAKTLYAKWTETTYTVNVALAVAAQSNGTTSPNGNTQVGAVTPVTITAPAPKTGYLSTGRWTTTGGVTVANPTANPTTITATSNGTVRWTFDEDLTTIWYLTGSFNSWSATANKFEKKTGESTGKVAYTTVDLAANTTCTFGVSDGTTYYSNNNTTDAPTYYIKGTVEDWTFESNLGYGINCGMVSTLAGTYTFKIDFSGTNPKVSVYYPEIYAISGSFNSWSESNNLSFTDNDGTYEVTINGSSTNYEFKVLDNAVWYGHADKTFTATENNVTLASGGNNIKLKADVYPNGTYTFTYNKSTKKLGVTYPTSFVVNYGKRTGGSTVTAKINNETAFSTGTKIKSGTSVTFSQTAATGYTFEGWYDAASGGTKLSSSATYTTTITAAKTVYANYTEQLYTIEVQNSNGTAGTITVPAAPATNVSAGIVTHPTITAVANPGYHFTGWTKTVTGSNVTIADASAASTTISNATGTATIQANWAANTYTVVFNKHKGDYYGTVTGTMANQGFTYDAAATALRTNTYALTGYTFLGWSTKSDQDEANFNASTHDYDYLDGASVRNLTATNGGTVTMYAIWRPIQYTITYNANGGTCGTSSQTAYFYNTVTGVFPVASKTNKHFNGWYTAASDGTQLATNSAWLENVTDYLTSYKWIKPIDTEVFAQYSDPAMGTTTFSATAVAKGGTVTVYPHVTTAPDDSYSIWLELQNMDGTPVATQPTAFSTAVGKVASVLQTTFTAPTIGSTYKVVATMRAGSTSSGTVLATAAAASFEVETDHVITIVYVDNDRNIIAPSTTTTALQSDSTVITAPEILGYSFSYWKSSNEEDLWFTTTNSDHDADNATAYIYAQANATDTAFYNEKKMIYFYNNLGWDDVWVYFYSGSYWSDTDGSGSNTGGTYSGGHGHMTQIAGTDVWYLDYTNTANTNNIDVSSAGVVCFNKYEQNNYAKFYQTECAYRSDFCHNTTMPMYVPYTTASKIISSESTNYYNYGYWMHYPNQTGYKLRVYNIAGDGATEQTSKSTDFVASASIPMPFTATMSLEAGQTLYFKVSTQDGKWYRNANTMTAANHEQWEIVNESGNNTGITATAAGDYTFTLYYDIHSTDAATAEPKFRISVEYPLSEGDYRLMYSDNAHSAKVPSHIIHNVAGNVDTVNFFVRKNQSPVIRVDKCTNIAANGTITWNEGITTNLVSGKTFDKDTVYNIIVTVNEGATNVNYTAHEYYSGNYYIRTDAVSNGWDHYTVDADHQMVYSEYSMSLATNPYTYYKAKWATHGTNIKAVVATDYSPAVSDTLKGDDVISGLEPTVPGTGDAGANIRFSYNASTNTLYRAYLAGAQGGAFDPDFLKLTEDPDYDKMKDDGGSDIDYITFTDDGNWLYSATITASPGLQGALTAKYNGHTQTFYTTGTTILGGEGSEAQSILLRYDFKTGRLIRAWLPNGDITKNIDLQADMILIRHGQSDEPNGGVTQLTFTNGSVLNVETAYGVIELRYNDMVGQMNSWSDATSYRYCYYYLSFPFDVKISTIIGPGRYDYEWDIQQYRGDLRASEGWFLADGRTTFWETMPQSGTLHKNVGYLLRLSRADFNVKVAGGVWDNKSAGSKLYYYFPSTSALGTITDHTNVPLYVPEHVCEIDRIFTQDIEAGKTTEALGGRNHKYTDSNWNMIGSPLFENQTGSVVSTTRLYDSTEINYLYTWNYSSNSLSVTRAHNFTFNSMYGYMVQFAGQINFTGASIGAAVAAPRRADSEKNYTIEMQLFKGDTQAANTYIELKDDGHDNYMLNEDLYLMASGKAAIYTYAGGYDVAANILSVNNHVIPVGVKTNAAGEYTFSMPSDFDGTVVLVDNFDGSRTDLSLGDYSVALPKGTIEDRFTLEINIERSSATDIEGIEGGNIKDGKAHKFVRDGIMYILRDGVIYDAMGKRVK